LVYLPSMTRSPTCHSDAVLEHYRRVAKSLIFGKTANFAKTAVQVRAARWTLMVPAMKMNPEQGTRSGLTTRGT
jgi:hypothetical protein